MMVLYSALGHQIKEVIPFQLALTVTNVFIWERAGWMKHLYLRPDQKGFIVKEESYPTSESDDQICLAVTTPHFCLPQLLGDDRL